VVRRFRRVLRFVLRRLPPIAFVCQQREEDLPFLFAEADAGAKAGAKAKAEVGAVVVVVAEPFEEIEAVALAIADAEAEAEAESGNTTIAPLVSHFVGNMSPQNTVQPNLRILLTISSFSSSFFGIS